jgi:hypothetical protein
LVEAYDIIRQTTTLEETAFDALEWFAAMGDHITTRESLVSDLAAIRQD